MRLNFLLSALAFSPSPTVGDRSGRLVVVSEAGGLPELVRDDVVGLVVPHGDAFALASAMSGLAAESTQVAAMSSAIRPVRSVAEHVEDLLTAYASLPAGRLCAISNGHPG